MKVTSLEITVPGYGDKAGQYVGSVRLESSLGKQELSLSSGAIGRIFTVIQQEAAETAKQGAKRVSQAIEEAANSTALIGHTIEGLE